MTLAARWKLQDWFAAMLLAAVLLAAVLACSCTPPTPAPAAIGAR